MMELLDYLENLEVMVDLVAKVKAVQIMLNSHDTISL